MKRKLRVLAVVLLALLALAPMQAGAWGGGGGGGGGGHGGGGGGGWNGGGGGGGWHGGGGGGWNGGGGGWHGGRLEWRRWRLARRLEWRRLARRLGGGWHGGWRLAWRLGWLAWRVGLGRPVVLRLGWLGLGRLGWLGRRLLLRAAPGLSGGRLRRTPGLRLAGLRAADSRRGAGALYRSAAGRGDRGAGTGLLRAAIRLPANGAHGRGQRVQLSGGTGRRDSGHRPVERPALFAAGQAAAKSISCRTGAPPFRLAKPSLISASLIRPVIR